MTMHQPEPVEPDEIDPALIADTLHISINTAPMFVVAWLQRHGQRAWYAGKQMHGVDARPVVMFDAGADSPVRQAAVDDTLTANPDGTVTVS